MDNDIDLLDQNLDIEAIVLERWMAKIKQIQREEDIFHTACLLYGSGDGRPTAEDLAKAEKFLDEPVDPAIKEVFDKLGLTELMRL